MKKSLRIYAMAFLVMAILVLAAGAQSAAQYNQPAQSQQNLSSQSPANEANETLSPEAEDKLIREVRHELIMLPWYGVFDNLAFRVDGRTVTLAGQVTNPTLKSDAERAVKRIEGVDKVVNN